VKPAPETYEAELRDPEGNGVQLWQPICPQ
jgi:hypothetical protein